MSGIIEAVTYGAGSELNAAGGVRLTRVAQAAQVGDTELVLERTLGLPGTGTLQVDNVTYTYKTVRDGAVGQLSVVTPQGTFYGVQLAHALGTVAVDASRSYSALDALRAGLFVDTAEGDDLSILGRILGVPRQNDVADDDTYRAIIKAMAYSPRPTRLGLSAALDAIAGPGHYVLAEDPDKPGVVRVFLDDQRLLTPNPWGKWYLNATRPGALEGDTVTCAGPTLAVSRLVAAPVVFDLAATAEPFEARAVTDGWGQSTTPLATSASGAFAPATLAPGVPAQQNVAPGFLSAAGPVDASEVTGVSAVICVPDASALSATDARRFALALSDGAQAVILGCVASAGQVALVLCDGQGMAVTDVLATVTEGQAVALRLTCDGPQGAVLVHRDGRQVLSQALSVAARPAGLPQGAHVGALGDAAAGVLVANLSVTLRSRVDLGVAATTDVTAGTVAITPSKTLPPGIGRFEVTLSDVLSGQVVDNVGPINHRLADGPKPTYLLWPTYLYEPVHLAQTYLSAMVALGIDVQVTAGLEQAR